MGAMEIGECSYSNTIRFTKPDAMGIAKPHADRDINTMPNADPTAPVARLYCGTRV